MDKRFYWGLGIILCIVIGISFTSLLMVMAPLLIYFTHRFFKRDEELIKEPHKPGRKKGSGKGRANYSHKPIKTPLHDGENKK